MFLFQSYEPWDKGPELNELRKATGTDPKTLREKLLSNPENLNDYVKVLQNLYDKGQFKRGLGLPDYDVDAKKLFEQAYLEKDQKKKGELIDKGLVALNDFYGYVRTTQTLSSLTPEEKKNLEDKTGIDLFDPNGKPNSISSLMPWAWYLPPLWSLQLFNLAKDTDPTSKNAWETVLSYIPILGTLQDIEDTALLHLTGRYVNFFRYSNVVGEIVLDAVTLSSSTKLMQRMYRPKWDPTKIGSKGWVVGDQYSLSNWFQSSKFFQSGTRQAENLAFKEGESFAIRMIDKDAMVDVIVKEGALVNKNTLRPIAFKEGDKFLLRTIESKVVSYKQVVVGTVENGVPKFNSVGSIELKNPLTVNISEIQVSSNKGSKVFSIDKMIADSEKVMLRRSQTKDMTDVYKWTENNWERIGQCNTKTLPSKVQMMLEKSSIEIGSDGVVLKNGQIVYESGIKLPTKENIVGSLKSGDITFKKIKTEKEFMEALLNFGEGKLKNDSFFSKYFTKGWKLNEFETKLWKNNPDSPANMWFIPYSTFNTPADYAKNLGAIGSFVLRGTLETVFYVPYKAGILVFRGNIFTGIGREALAIFNSIFESGVYHGAVDYEQAKNISNAKPISLNKASQTGESQPFDRWWASNKDNVKDAVTGNDAKNIGDLVQKVINIIEKDFAPEEKPTAYVWLAEQAGSEDSKRAYNLATSIYGTLVPKDQTSLNANYVREKLGITKKEPKTDAPKEKGAWGEVVGSVPQGSVEANIVGIINKMNAADKKLTIDFLVGKGKLYLEGDASNTNVANGIMSYLQTLKPAGIDKGSDQAKIDALKEYFRTKGVSYVLSESKPKRLVA